MLNRSAAHTKYQSVNFEEVYKVNSLQERQAQNRKLSVDLELAVCQYLDLDTIGTSARVQMVASCANLNLILQNSPNGPDPAPIIGDNGAPRFLECHLEYFIKK